MNIEIGLIRAKRTPPEGAGEALSDGKRFTPDQQVLVDLAKDAKKNGGISADDADTLLGWADEYNVPHHGPEVHPNRPGAASNIPHIHIGKTGHISILDR